MELNFYIQLVVHALLLKEVKKIPAEIVILVVQNQKY